MKIHIIGGPGSGKTTLAKQLSEKLGIPRFDLDDLQWDNASGAYGTRRAPQERDALLAEILKHDDWIIEGVYYAWCGQCFADADQIRLLHVPRRVYRRRIIRRFLLRKLGLEIPCFSSNCVLAYEDGAKIAPTEIGEYVALANKCGASYVRILADAHPAPEGEVDDEKIIAELKDLAPLCEGKNVTLLVETNGVYADTARLRKLIEAVDSPYVKVLWDVHHPFRYFGESVETTWANVGEYVRYIHVKDSIKEDDGTVAYRLPGHGDLPLEALFELLDKNGYNGFVSLEWVKRWAKEIESAAIVFPQFINFVRTWEKTKGTKKVIEPSKKESKAQVRPEAPIEVVPSNIKYVEKGKGQRMFEKDVLVEMTFGQMLDKVATEFPDQTAFAYTMRDYTRTSSRRTLT